MDRRKRAVTAEISDEEEARIQDVIASDPDNPEWTDEQFARAKAATDVLPSDLLAELKSRGGRPRSPSRKLPVKLRLDPDVVEGFRALGPGWQTRMNEVLKRELPKLRKRAG
jgi:uncharacterized protein (DUF4415 family)